MNQNAAEPLAMNATERDGWAKAGAAVIARSVIAAGGQEKSDDTIRRQS